MSVGNRFHQSVSHISRNAPKVVVLERKSPRLSDLNRCVLANCLGRTSRVGLDIPDEMHSLPAAFDELRHVSIRKVGGRC